MNTNLKFKDGFPMKMYMYNIIDIATLDLHRITFNQYKNLSCQRMKLL